MITMSFIGIIILYGPKYRQPRQCCRGENNTNR